MEDENVDDNDEDELVELPGGIDQLEAIMEDMQSPEDNSFTVFKKHEKAGDDFLITLNRCTD